MITIKGCCLFILYILRHKRLVARQCFRRGLYRRGLTHDLSKLLPNEFLPYARYWSVWGWRKVREPDLRVPTEILRHFRSSVICHKQRNSHHLEYWLRPDSSGQMVPVDMSKDAIMEMVCDWEAMSEMYRNSSGAKDWYRLYGDKMTMTDTTRQRLETILENLKSV